MASIDELKAQRDEIQSTIEALQVQRQRAVSQAQALQARIDAKQARKAVVVQAIRDLTDTRAPAP